MPRVPVRVALAGGVRLSGVRVGSRGRDAPAPAAVAVQATAPADLGDGGDGDARDAHAVADVVLGGLPGRHPSPGISAKQLQRQLGLSRYETAWLILQKLRRAMVAPEREPLRREVEIDEFFLGGYEEGLKGGRQRGKKALVGVAIEVRGAGSGRLRLAVLPDASRPHAGDVHQGHDRARRDRAHRRLQRLPRPGQARLRPPPAPADRRARRATAAPRAPRDLQPQGVDARHPPRRLATSTCRSTSTSTSSATTAAAPRWPPSRPSSGSAPCTNRRPTARSPDEPHDPKRNQPEYAPATLTGVVSLYMVRPRNVRTPRFAKQLRDHFG